MRDGASIGRGGGSCALGVDRRHSVETTGRGKGGFGQVAVARGSAGSHGEARRGEARRSEVRRDEARRRERSDTLG